MDVFLSPKRQGSFKGVLRKFKRCFKEVSRTFQESFKDVSRKFKGCFKELTMSAIMSKYSELNLNY